MSYKIGMDTIHLRPTPRLAHAASCDHDPLKRLMASRYAGPAPVPPFADLWDTDYMWNTNDGPVPWSERGRATDMGHADFLEGGVDRRMPKPCPFKSDAEVWAFDAVKEYGLPDFAQLTNYYENNYQTGQKAFANQVFPAGYYKTLVSGAIEAFGWDMLLEAAADQDKFEAVLDSIFRLSLHHFKAWARTSAPVFICHDDMVWTEGPFIHPDFYRRAIFPRYAQLWSVLKQAGKKVLYCCDGNFTQFVGDIVKAGADGFIFEPLTSLDEIVARCGRTHVIIGSKLDCRTLTFGTPQQIQAEIDATLQLASGCPGFIFNVGNHIASNVPVENALFYLEYLKKHWARG